MPTEYRLSYPVDTVCWTDGFIRPLPPEHPIYCLNFLNAQRRLTAYN